MTFRNKILLSIYGVVLSLLVITFFIINYWTRTRIENTFAGELQANLSAIQMLTRLQSETLIRSCLVIAESPRLRAVAEVGDPTTAYELSRELSGTTMSKLFILTDRRGEPLARVVDQRSSNLEIADRASIRSAIGHVATTDVWALQKTVFRIVSAPILVDTELIGTLTIGFPVTREDVATLKQATNSDVMLALNDSVIVSTLDSATTLALNPAIRAGAVHGDNGDTSFTILTLPALRETFLGTALRLSKQPHSVGDRVHYILVKPFSREVSGSMASILGTFGIISFVFLGLTTVIGIVISRGMAKPITDLVDGTVEVSRGNYDYAIPIRGDDEISFLGKKFMEMSQTLKEKIAQLDRLNGDLVERNADLDETLQKLREAQQELVRNERLAATGKLTAQLAHEINNPIHNIQSCLQTALKRLPADSRGRELIEVAYDEVGRMSRLTGQMLDIYRSSYSAIKFEDVQIGEVIQETISAMEADLSNAGIAARTTIPPGLPTVKGSKDKLKQVFLNLLLNARDAMPQGGTLKICVERSDGSVRVSVADTGVGIPKENLNRIFDAFFTTKDKVSGVGLGLSVVYGIVSQHDGTITVRSEPGRGATFVVTLPLQNQRSSSPT